MALAVTLLGVTPASAANASTSIEAVILNYGPRIDVAEGRVLTRREARTGRRRSPKRRMRTHASREARTTGAAG